MSSVTVIMPAYNAARYLRSSIDSILNQTFSDFILMILNDGSTDDTENVILSYTDKRIQYVKNERNIGLSATLNKAIDLTQTEYYARLDADDIAVPQRLEWQIAFMNEHPEIGVSGGLFEIFGNENSISKLPLDDSHIKSNLLFASSIPHSAVIIRTELLKKNNIRFGVPFSYDDGHAHKILELEDYALWHKLKFVTQFANLNKVLIKYRKEGQNLTVQKMDLIRERKKKFHAYYLKELGVSPTEINLQLHSGLSYITQSKSVNDLRSFKLFLDELIETNRKNKIYPPVELKE